ncbi:MAG: biotin--[acetyl-CoA-carboxylase] ligase [Legionella sp.]
MKKFNNTQLELLTILADGATHSGSDLGAKLGISRTAIWKHIQKLRQFNIPISAIANQGYQFATPIVWLDETVINDHLKASNFDKPLKLHLLQSIDSTNHFLKKLSPSTTIDVCCAEMQTAGRGRFGRSWYSPFAENIYLSLRWTFTDLISKLSGLSLIVSLATVAVLTELGVDEHLRIKWPNDILWHDKKISGSLIEIHTESNSSTDIIIGIGLNVNSHVTTQNLINKPWSSLYQITGKIFNRNLIIGRLIVHLIQYIELFFEHGFEKFQKIWGKFDYLSNQTIEVSHASGISIGIAKGVNTHGQLILESFNGERQYLSSGDTTIINY